MGSELPAGLPEFLAGLSSRLDLRTVILDHWRGWRLIFETGDTLVCSGRCGICPTFLALGADDPALEASRFRTTLLPVPEDQRSVTDFPMLNCKTRAGYRRSFVHWLVHRCACDQDYRDETDLILGFRVVFPAGEAGKDIERDLRRGILDEAATLVGARARRVILDHAASRTETC